jgi:CBS domain-containing protein
MVKPHSEFAEEHLDELHKELHSTEVAAAGAPSPSDTRIHGHLIKEVPPRAAVSVSTSTSVADAIHAMIVRRIGCVLVVDGDELRGIFTERDVLMRVLESGKDFKTTEVSEFMTRDPETLRENDEVAYALNKMSVGGFRHVPILDSEGKPRFVLSVKDVVNYIVELAPSGVLNLPPEPSLTYPKRDSGG